MYMLITMQSCLTVSLISTKEYSQFIVLVDGDNSAGNMIHLLSTACIHSLYNFSLLTGGSWQNISYYCTAHLKISDLTVLLLH